MRRILLNIVILGCFVLCVLYVSTVVIDEQLQFKNIPFLAQQRHLPENSNDLSQEDINWLKRRSIKGKSITPLGNWLLSPEGTSPPEKNTNNHLNERPYLILIWKHGPLLERRHVRRFSNDRKFSPWDNCSIKNCKLTYNSSDLHNADAVIFHLHQTRDVHYLPKRQNQHQRWIFLSDESPLNTFLQNNQSLDDYNGLFNWSMTYRIDSDVPVPYGRTVFKRMKDESLDVERIVGDKKYLVAVLGSNCGGVNKRWDYIDKLKSLLGDDLKIFGRCHHGDRTTCPGHFNNDCPALNQFKFYLAFENTNCREYLTEKVFWNSYSKFSVPILMGARKIDYQLLLPPRSYLHVDDFANPHSLADYLHYLDENNDEYLSYHQWRVNYRTIDEHGYFGSSSRHYCRVCEALNYNDPNVKIYQRLHDFWSSRNDCQN